MRSTPYIGFRTVAREKFWGVISQIIIRRRYRCPVCLRPGDHYCKTPEVHHRDGDKANNSPDNLLAVCRFCHDREHEKEINKWRRRKVRGFIVDHYSTASSAPIEVKQIVDQYSRDDVPGADQLIEASAAFWEQRLDWARPPDPVAALSVGEGAGKESLLALQKETREWYENKETIERITMDVPPKEDVVDSLRETIQSRLTLITPREIVKECPVSMGLILLYFGSSKQAVKEACDDLGLEMLPVDGSPESFESSRTQQIEAILEEIEQTWGPLSHEQLENCLPYSTKGGDATNHSGLDHEDRVIGDGRLAEKLPLKLQGSSWFETFEDRYQDSLAPRLDPSSSPLSDPWRAEDETQESVTERQARFEQAVKDYYVEYGQLPTRDDLRVSDDIHPEWRLFTDLDWILSQDNIGIRKGLCEDLKRANEAGTNFLELIPEDNTEEMWGMNWDKWPAESTPSPAATPLYPSNIYETLYDDDGLQRLLWTIIDDDRSIENLLHEHTLVIKKNGKQCGLIKLKEGRVVAATTREDIHEEIEEALQISYKRIQGYEEDGYEHSTEDIYHTLSMNASEVACRHGAEVWPHEESSIEGTNYEKIIQRGIEMGQQAHNLLKLREKRSDRREVWI